MVRASHVYGRYRTLEYGIAWTQARGIGHIREFAMHAIIAGMKVHHGTARSPVAIACFYHAHGSMHGTDMCDSSVECMWINVCDASEECKVGTY
jgi:hypothetical protein